MMEICPICGTSYDDICLSCLSIHSKCVLCFQEFKQHEEIIHCGECDYLGHADPLEEWLQSKGYCPICKITYGEDNFKRINLGEGLLSGFVSRKIERYRKRLEIFDAFSFRLPFYDFQSAIIYDMEQRLQTEDSYLFVSPPGSGKTIIGLAMANKLGRNTLVLTPNLAVLGSWLDRAEMFFDPLEGKLKASEVMSKEEGDLRPITILTYQKLNSALRNRQESWRVPEKEGKKEDVLQERDYLVDRLIHHNIGLLILDEAHRLTKTWGSNVLELLAELEDVKIMGLTATPPENNELIYDQIFGGYAKTIPLPLLVREGILVPYQDLGVLLPDQNELRKHISSITKKYTNNVNQELSDQISGVDRENLATVTRLYLDGYDEIKYLSTADIKDKKKYYEWLSSNTSLKMALALEILHQEYRNLGEQTRILILLEQENLPTGYNLRYKGLKGAIGVFEQLVLDPMADQLDPILVTGKSLLVDDDFTPLFIEEGEKWMQRHQLEIRLSVRKLYHKKYSIISGSGRDWNTDTYTRYVTYLFDLGITKCLVGTRFLLGEGWDSLSLNTVIDLTTFYSAAAVKQAKGRALRRDPEFQRKASNIWEIIPNPDLTEYAAQELERFEKRHQTYFGIDEQGNIRNGMDRLVPGYKRRFLSDFDTIRFKSLERSRDREGAFKLWQVGRKLGDLYYVFRFSIQLLPCYRNQYDSIAQSFAVVFATMTTVSGWNADYEYIKGDSNDLLTVKVYTSVDQDQHIIEELNGHFSSPTWDQGYAIEVTHRPSFLPLRRILSRYVSVDAEVRKLTLLIPSMEPVVDPSILRQQVEEGSSMKDLSLVEKIDDLGMYCYYSDHGMIYPQFHNIQQDHISDFSLEHEFMDR